MPPTQASTWKRIPRSLAAAAISAMGSMVPWEKLGAEPTPSMVFGPRAARKASTSARKPSVSTGRHDHAQPEVVGGLVEGRVGGDRQHDLGIDRLRAVDAGVVARRLDREHDALGAAAGHVADDLIVAPQQVGHRANHVLLHAAGARVHVDVERVLGEEARVGVGGQLVGVTAGVVQARQNAAAAPVDILSAPAAPAPPAPAPPTARRVALPPDPLSPSRPRFAPLNVSMDRQASSARRAQSASAPGRPTGPGRMIS